MLIEPITILALIAIFVLIIIFYFRPDLGILIVLLSILAGQLLTIPLNQNTSVLLSDLLTPLLFMLWILRKFLRREKLSSNMVAPTLFLFLFLAIISFVNGLRYLTNSSDALSSLFYLIRLISMAGLFFIASSEIKSEEKIYNFKKVLLFVFIVFALFGIFQVIFSPNMGQAAIKEGWDPHVGRLFSTFLDPNFAGAFLVFGFIFSLSLFLYSRTMEAKIITTTTALLTLIGVILTYSRSSYLFLAISFFIFAFIKSRRLLLIGVVAIIALLIIFPRSLDRIQGGFDIDASARSRFQSWENTLTIVKDHPVLGVGYNAFRPAQIAYGFVEEDAIAHASAGSDSSLLSILATTGILGLISYLIFYLAALIKTKKVYNFSLSLQKRALALAILSLLIGLIFHSIFVNSLLYPALMIPLFLTLGVVTAAKN